MQLVPSPAKDSAILAAALQFASAGFSVVPASMNGTKAPISTWKKYQESAATYEQILEWFSNGETGLGVVTGFNNLEMIELEGRAVQSGLLEEAREIAINSGLGEIWNTLNGYVELTPSGGLHWLYRLEEGAVVPGNTKIARRPGVDGGVEVLCETRGTGGYVVVAPSHASVHPSGNPWVMISGSPATIPVISREDRDAIHLVFRALDSMPSIEQVREAVSTPKTDGLSPGDDFNAKADWTEILIGWAKLYTSRGVTYWRRPGKDDGGISATTGRNDGDNLYVFSTSTPFDAEKPYSKFAAVATLQHGGDFKACAKELRRNGYGAIALSVPLTPVPALTSAQLDILRADREAKAEEAGGDIVYIETVAEIKERTSWWPKPLDIYDTEAEPEPEFLARDDKSKLFYRGKVNGIMGESESGKTWVALHAVQQALCVGQKVIYLDFEDSARGIMNRLRALGTMDEHLVNLTYAQPDEQMSLEARADLYESLAQMKPDLVVVDGVNAAMTLLGLDLISNTDATKFSQMILRPLTTSGAAVITIDHVTKSKENQGSFAIGAQAKRADVNGALIKCDLEAPFGRGLHGVLKLIVAKDRPGYVRAIAAGGKYLGSAHLQSYGDGKVRISIIPEINEFDSFRPTHVMEVVSTYLASQGPGAVSQTQIETASTGKAVTIRAALKVLVAEGFVKMENGARGSLNFAHVAPYLELSDHTTEKSKVAQMDASLLKTAE